MKNYELIEHTADIFVRIRGLGLKSLFRNAGLAITDITSEKLHSKDRQKHKLIVTQKADSLDELFVNWLNELLSLSAVEGLIFEDIRIKNLSDKFIEAEAIGSDIKNFKVNTEIKAATYHELKLKKTLFGWQAEVIFDA